jgi:hypothetical protein
MERETIERYDAIGHTIVDSFWHASMVLELSM